MVLETGGGEEFHVINARIVKRGSKQLCKLLLCFTPAPCHMLPLSGWASFTAATLLSNTLSSFWEVMILNGWITLIFGEIMILNGWTGWATVNFASSVRRKPSVFWMWGEVVIWKLCPLPFLTTRHSCIYYMKIRCTFPWFSMRNSTN